MSKRVKINFESINKGNYTVIHPKDIAEINRKIKIEMTPIIREFERKEFESWLQGAKNLMK
jgi:hypothetical protein